MEHDLAQELAKLSLAIQEGRREFDELKAGTALYLEEREVAATNRVAIALERSRQAVEEINDHVRLIETLQNEMANIINEVKVAKVNLQEERRETQKRTEEIQKYLETKSSELVVEIEKIQQERMKLDGAIESMRMERGMLADEQKKIDDDRGKLRAAMMIWRKQNETTIE